MPERSKHDDLIYFDLIDQMELENLGYELPESPITADEAVVFAESLLSIGTRTAGDAFWNHDATRKESLVEYHKAQRIADGLSVISNRILELTPMEHLAYLEQRSQK